MDSGQRLCTVSRALGGLARESRVRTISFQRQLARQVRVDGVRLSVQTTCTGHMGWKRARGQCANNGQNAGHKRVKCQGGTKKYRCGAHFETAVQEKPLLVSSRTTHRSVLFNAEKANQRQRLPRCPCFCAPWLNRVKIFSCTIDVAVHAAPAVNDDASQVWLMTLHCEAGIDSFAAYTFRDDLGVEIDGAVHCGGSSFVAAAAWIAARSPSGRPSVGLRTKSSSTGRGQRHCADSSDSRHARRDG